MSTEDTEVIIFRSNQQELIEFPFGDHATVTVWQGIGGKGFLDRMGVGFATYKGRFNWLLRYDAVYYFLSGTLKLTCGGVTHTADSGDVMFIPSGSDVIYDSPGGCRVFWAIYPSNWEDISDFSVAQATEVT